jgi:hypothetical protein
LCGSVVIRGLGIPITALEATGSASRKTRAA